MHYYYNENTKSFAVTTNFTYDPIPNGYREITEEEYKELQEELQQESQNDNEIPKVEYNENI